MLSFTSGPNIPDCYLRRTDITESVFSGAGNASLRSDTTLRVPQPMGLGLCRETSFAMMDRESSSPSGVGG